MMLKCGRDRVEHEQLSMNELQTQIELAARLGFFVGPSSEALLDLGTRDAKLINGLLGVLEPDVELAGALQLANSPRA